MLRPKRLEWFDCKSGRSSLAKSACDSYHIECGLDRSAWFASVRHEPFDSIEAAKAACQAHYDAAWLAGGEDVEDHEKNKLFNDLQDERGIVDRWIEATGYRDPTTYKNRELPDFS